MDAGGRSSREQEDGQGGTRGMSRREFLQGVGAGALALAASSGPAGGPEEGRVNVERIDCSRARPHWEGAKPFPRQVTHPMRYAQEQIDRALRRVETLDWAKRYRDRLVRTMERRDILTTPDDALRREISDQVNFPLPRCPVDRRQRSWRSGFWDWSPKDPTHVRCRICGSVLPGPEHESTGEMVVVGEVTSGGETGVV